MVILRATSLLERHKMDTKRTCSITRHSYHFTFVILHDETNAYFLSFSINSHIPIGFDGPPRRSPPWLCASSTRARSALGMFLVCLQECIHLCACCLHYCIWAIKNPPENNCVPSVPNLPCHSHYHLYVCLM